MCRIAQPAVTKSDSIDDGLFFQACWAAKKHGAKPETGQQLQRFAGAVFRPSQ